LSGLRAVASSKGSSRGRRGGHRARAGRRL